jgi:hypothetical protein
MTERPAKSTAYLQVVLMFAIIVATLALGFFMFPASQQERDQLLNELGTTNHGTLLTPMAAVAGLPLSDEAGNPWRWQDHKPKWRMLIPSGATCEGECAELLYTTRQVHLRLGKYTHRLERFLVVTEGELAPEFRESLKTDHPYLKVIHGEGAALSTWLAQTNSPWQAGDGKVILVDPEGMAMMVYDASHNGNGMLEDLNHLLKYSPE